MKAAEIEIKDSRIVKEFGEIKIGDIFISELNHVCIKLDPCVDTLNAFDFNLNIRGNFHLSDIVIIPNKVSIKVET